MVNNNRIAECHCDPGFEGLNCEISKYSDTYIKLSTVNCSNSHYKYYGDL